MKKLHSFIKYLVAILLGTALVGMSVYAVQIPTSLGNALQYIMETVWTSNGTSSGTVNVDISTGGIYIATGFLQNGTGRNSKALGVDASGNVVYVTANAISNPLLFPTANYIPKINPTQNGLDVSTMYQIGGLIGVNTQTPVKSVDILGDFQVTTQGSSVTYQYNFFQTSATPILLSILQTQQCGCDTTLTGSNCSAPFAATAGDLLFCVDVTAQDTGNSNNYFYNIYQKQQIGISEAVLVTSGNRVGVRTYNPQAALDVSGDVRIATVPVGSASWQVLVQNPVTNIVSRISPGLLGGTGVTQTLSLAGWVLSILNGNSITLPTPTLSIVGNTLTISGSTQNSVTLPTIGGSNGWNLTGNAGTTPGTNFVGTTDNKDLVIKVNNAQIQRYYVNGSIIGGLSQTYSVGTNATIAGGMQHQLSGDFATIGGGAGNAAMADNATIAGGISNGTNGRSSFIGGGQSNNNYSLAGVIGGGISNNTKGDFAIVAGGFSQSASGAYSAVVGGNGNGAMSANSFIGGGESNFIGFNGSFWPGSYSAIVGGKSNKILSIYGFIGGGLNNMISQSSSNLSTIVGGSGNTIGVSSAGAIIGGGYDNEVKSINGSILGGQTNSVSASLGSIGGGSNNTISGPGLYGVIGGGDGNTVLGQYGTVGGGERNTAGSIGSTVVGGYVNSASGAYSTVVGGSNNNASGQYSLAAGQNATASGDNSFVWTDGTPYASNRDNEFAVSSDHIVLAGLSYGTGFNLFSWLGTVIWLDNLYRTDGISILLGGSVGMGQFYAVSGTVSNLVVSNSFTNLSDARLKTNVVSGSNWATPGLDLVTALNPVTYNWDQNQYTTNSSFDFANKHYGFLAQQVEGVIPDIISTVQPADIGYNGKEISSFKSVDEIEIIPVLVQAMKEQQAEITNLQAQIDVLTQYNVSNP